MCLETEYRDFRLIGLGQLLRGDDALGILALRQLIHTLKPDLLAHFSTFELNGEAASLVYHLQGAKKVLILDAIQTGDRPGCLVTYDASQQVLPRSWLASTHGFGLAEALELSRALGDLPSEILILGLCPADFSLGSALSPPVRIALPDLVKQAQKIVLDWSITHA